MRRCGICRGTGHNRQTCSNLKTPAAVVTPENTTNTPPAVMSTRTASGRRKPSCSYCRNKFYKVDRTHTCRTCPTRKGDLASWVEENKVWAKEHKKKMMELGIGEGSLISYGGEEVYEIEGINFDEISKSSNSGYFGKMIGYESDRYFTRSRVYYTDNTFQVVSPIPAHMVAGQFPKDWEKGIYGVPYRLRDSKRSRQTKKK